MEKGGSSTHELDEIRWIAEGTEEQNKSEIRGRKDVI